MRSWGVGVALLLFTPLAAAGPTEDLPDPGSTIGLDPLNARNAVTVFGQTIHATRYANGSRAGVDASIMTLGAGSVAHLALGASDAFVEASGCAPTAPCAGATVDPSRGDPTEFVNASSPPSVPIVLRPDGSSVDCRAWSPCSQPIVAGARANESEVGAQASAAFGVLSLANASQELALSSAGATSSGCAIVLITGECPWIEVQREATSASACTDLNLVVFFHCVNASPQGASTIACLGMTCLTVPGGLTTDVCQDVGLLSPVVVDACLRTSPEAAWVSVCVSLVLERPCIDRST